MKNTIDLNEMQAKQLADLIDAGEEFYIHGWGCYLQLREPTNHGSWTALVNDTSGG